MKELIFQKVELTIRDLTGDGDGVGQYQGFTLFVPGALIGEKVLVKVKKVKKNYGLAKLLSVLQPSKNRVTPKCPYFNNCGGCQIMHLNYEGQCLVKQSRIEEAFLRIGKIDISEKLSFFSSPCDENYRNKIQMPFCLYEDKLAVGLYSKGSHNIVPIRECLIHNTLAESIVSKVVDTLDHYGFMPFNDSQSPLAVLKHLLIKTAIKNQEILIVIITHSKPLELLRKCAEDILKIHPSIKGVVHHENMRFDNVLLDQKFSVLSGKDHIIEVLNGLKFKISAPSFFQVNPFQAENLYKKAITFGDLKKGDIVIDAYCGIGTFSLQLAKYVKEVIGIEYVGQAILDAQENSDLNGLNNVKFLTGDVKKLLPEIQSADVIYLNPPRKGCDSDVLKQVIKFQPKIIVYISCDPTTLARDAALLCEEHYEIAEVCGFDMFPQTMHVETCAKFIKKHS